MTSGASVTQPESREIVTDRFADADGREQIRASSADFRTLSKRHVDRLYTIPGFGGDIEKWVNIAYLRYERGEYEIAARFLLISIRALPAIKPLLFYYLRRCSRVIGVPPTAAELDYDYQLTRYRAKPNWYTRLFARRFTVCLRCKWCGHLVPYVHPDQPTFGFVTTANSCALCHRMYPMPSWQWDSPDGRAYSYYRHSFSDSAFYEEFEADYEPQPRMAKSESGKWAPAV